MSPTQLGPTIRIFMWFPKTNRGGIRLPASRITAGTGLLAMGHHLQHDCRLSLRYREQARSHIGYWCTSSAVQLRCINLANTEDLLWERACSRNGQHIHHQW